MATLRAELDAGRISKEKFDQMGQQLDRSSLQARDPIGAELKSLQQQQELLKIGGDYKDADRKTQETHQPAHRAGHRRSPRAQVEQLSAANRQLQDMEKAQNSGLTGWANSVGSLKDNLMDMTKDFAPTCRSAISGALEGKRGGFTAMLRKLGSNMISTGVNQMMKQAIQGVQNGAGGQGGGIGGLVFSKMFGGGAKKAVDAAKTAANGATAANDALSSLGTASMTVNAASVFINGSPVGAPGGIPGLDGAPGRARSPARRWRRSRKRPTTARSSPRAGG